MQIVNIPMQTVCIPECKTCSIHLFRTVGDPNLALIINEFGRVKGSCLRSAYGRKIAVRILLEDKDLNKLFHRLRVLHNELAFLQD